MRQDLVLHAAEDEECATSNHKEAEGGVDQPINTRNVHRTNALRGHPWGRDFVYSERMACGDGPEGESRARRLARRLQPGRRGEAAG